MSTAEQGDTIASITQQYNPQLKASLYTYNPQWKASLYKYKPAAPPNAGIAKNEAYTILKTYLSQPTFMFAADTRRAVSEFSKAVRRFAVESPAFGGTVAAKRHPQRCQWMGAVHVPVKGGFLQQAVIFSCKGTPTSSNHFSRHRRAWDKDKLQRSTLWRCCRISNLIVVRGSVP